MSADKILREQAVQRVLRRLITETDISLGVQSEHASIVVQYLHDEGFTLVPVTIYGASGWTPSELSAYQAGIMHERFENRR